MIQILQDAMDAVWHEVGNNAEDEFIVARLSFHLKIHSSHIRFKRGNLQGTKTTVWCVKLDRSPGWVMCSNELYEKMNGTERIS